MKSIRVAFGFIALLAVSAHGASISELITQLTDSDPDLRKQAAAGLATSGQQDYGAINALEARVNDISEQPMVRGTAAYALAMIHPQLPSSVLSELIRICEDQRSEELNNRAHEAFKRQGDAAIAPLSNALAAREASWGFVFSGLQAIGTEQSYAELSRLQEQANGHESAAGPNHPSLKRPSHSDNSVTDYHRKKYDYNQFPEIKKTE